MREIFRRQDWCDFMYQSTLASIRLSTKNLTISVAHRNKLNEWSTVCYLWVSCHPNMVVLLLHTGGFRSAPMSCLFILKLVSASRYGIKPERTTTIWYVQGRNKRRHIM